MATQPLKLRPWRAPNYANVDMPLGRRQDGFTQLPSFALSELAQEALDDLTEQWLNDVYRTAGKVSPWRK
jgi:hypothetical protein